MKAKRSAAKNAKKPFAMDASALIVAMIVQRRFVAPARAWMIFRTAMDAASRCVRTVDLPVANARRKRATDVPNRTLALIAERKFVPTAKASFGSAVARKKENLF